MKKIVALSFCCVLFGLIVNVQGQNIELLGAGATFPYPLDSKMFDEYYKSYGIKVNYQAIGSGRAVNWQLGLGARGNPGLAGLILQTPGSIGYVELIYALNNNMSVGAVKNKSGNFIIPSICFMHCYPMGQLKELKGLFGL